MVTRIAKWTFACVVIVGLLTPAGCDKKKSSGDGKGEDKSLERIAPRPKAKDGSLPELKRKKPRAESKSPDLTPMGYLSIVVRSKDRGKMIRSAVNLRSLSQEIRMYEMQEGKYPASLEELVRKTGVSRKLITSGVSEEPIAYIRPAGPRPDANDILAFDLVNYLNNRFVVLFVNGTAKDIDIEDLEQRLKKQGVK